VAQGKIMRRRQERSGVAFDEAAKRVELFRRLGKLCFIAAPEFRKSFRLMPIPFAQRGRRRHVARPCIEFELGFGQSPRPKTVDENAQTVLWRGLLVGALDRDR
jgi:hypothetical protein